MVGYSGRESRDHMRIGSNSSGTNDYRSLAGTNYAQTDNVAVSPLCSHLDLFFMYIFRRNICKLNQKNYKTLEIRSGNDLS